jgi:FAD/FMN-containing dehydrogenase/Fe-S oxidoreductase
MPTPTVPVSRAASARSSSAPSPAEPLAAHHRDFTDALAQRIEGDLRTDEMTRALYATDASMYQVTPVAVLLPRTSADVQAALRASKRFDVPVLPRGGGSALAGQAVGPALVIDFSRYMSEIIDVDPQTRTARVEPGVVLDDLNRAAAEHGLMVGPDPASSNRATLGGMVANNATGTHSILYGNMIHHVRSLRGFLADGTPVTFGALSEEEWRAAYQRDGAEGRLYREIGALLSEGKTAIARDTPRHWRRNSGYRLEHLLSEETLAEEAFTETRPGIDGDPYFEPMEDGRNLAKIVCGSEGTLMTFTEIEVRLVERPERTALGIAHFETRQGALRAVERILETKPSAVELFDGVILERCRAAPGFADKLTFVEETPSGGSNGGDSNGGAPGGLLITEYSTSSGDSGVLSERLDALDDAVQQSDEGYTVVRRTDPDDIADVWKIRKEGLGLVKNIKSDYKPWGFIEDASVPVAELPGYIDELSALLDETGTKAVFYAHASGGCLHVRPFINTKDAEEVEKMKTIARGSMETVRRHGGAVSSEHGDGRARGWLNEELLGPELYELNRQLKHIFDPEGRLNPGIVVGTPPMDHDLRMGPSYRTRPLRTEMDFSEDGGFAGAVELCNGNGACRKTGSGTMCPSYMATHEEEHSTRGRANALRMAISGQLPDGELTGERMKDVMDLCIQCKACKTECPSNVDMGKLKKEWLAKLHEEEGLPLRDRFFSRLPTMSRIFAGTPLAGAVNAVNRLSPVRWGLEKTLGIDRQRKLPPFARETFRQWFEENNRSGDTMHRAPASESDRVAIFPDTFTNFNQPDVGKAATQVLSALGMRPVLPEQTVCCGRTLLSKGRISAAQERALATVEALLPFARAGLPIIGLEPSCTSALTDDLLSLLPGDPHAEAVAEAVVSFEGLLSRRAGAGELPSGNGVWNGDDRNVLLHGHCHQKSLEGAAPAKKALGLAPGHRVEAVEASCCGMAGSFGYEAEHVGVSKDMAELKLAPTVRAASDDTVVTAPGFSCRSQIADTTGREALHPAQVLADALAA